MADNAPYSANRPPYPNVHVNLPGRLEVYVATISYAAGTPSVVQTLSSAGITVTDTNTGRITIGFPAGGTGATGFVVQSLLSKASPNGQTSLELDSDVTSFATGALELDVFDEDDTSGIAAAADVTLQVTLLIYVLRAVS